MLSTVAARTAIRLLFPPSLSLSLTLFLFCHELDRTRREDKVNHSARTTNLASSLFFIKFNSHEMKFSFVTY